MMISESEILNASILIVDDQECNVILLEQLLGEAGYSCVASTMNPEAVCALHRKNRYDLILLDLQMPGMNGFQVMEELKQIDTDDYLPVLVITAQPGHKLRALQAGAKDFISKPLDLVEVKTRIHNMLEVRLLHTKLKNYSKLLECTVQDRTADLLKANVQLAQEIEERTRAENSLREQEHELATIFENAPFMMLLLDEERRVRKVNAQVCSFTGSTISDMVGRQSGEALRCVHALNSRGGCDFDPKCHDCAIRITAANTFETGKSHHQVQASLPLTIQGKVQSISFLLATTIVMVADQPMVLLTLQDINEYKKLEAQLHHAQKMESIGTFAGGIAHDFNNILTVIIGYAQLTIMNMSADNLYRQNIEQIVAAADRAAHLTSDLLLFSRKQVSDKKNIDLNDVIKSVDKFLLRIIGEDITFKTILSDKALPVFADAHHLEQVLMNLATNARDAMENGGDFTITVEQAKLDHAFIAAHGSGIPGVYGVLTVTDTGMGMDEKTQKHIFDPFFTTKEVGKGTGLGLSVIFGIVKDHDGFINVYSEPGKGTTFRIYLPLITATAGKEEMKTEEKPPDRGIETILLAEDDVIVRNMAMALLESFGYKVITAVDGEEAVQKFRENRELIKLLLFDMVMPNKNGKDAYDEIRKIKPDIKVIFASGYATDTMHMNAPANGTVMLISKPYLPTNLLAMVRSVLDNKQTKFQS